MRFASHGFSIAFKRSEHLPDFSTETRTPEQTSSSDVKTIILEQGTFRSELSVILLPHKDSLITKQTASAKHCDGITDSDCAELKYYLVNCINFPKLTGTLL